jgi:hypothetical protein
MVRNVAPTAAFAAQFVNVDAAMPKSHPLIGWISC